MSDNSYVLVTAGIYGTTSYNIYFYQDRVQDFVTPLLMYIRYITHGPAAGHCLSSDD